MLGWSIFKKSISQLSHNFGDVLRITGLLWLVSSLINTLISYLLYGETFSMDMSLLAEKMSQDGLKFSLIMFIWLVTPSVLAAWIAVLWHRFVLRGEHAGSSFPKWHGQLIWAYIVKSLILILVMLTILIPFTIAAVIFGVIIITISMAVDSPFAIHPSKISILILAPWLVYIFFRIAIVLPATALGNKLTISESWGITKSIHGEIFVSGALIFITNLALQEVGIGLIKNTTLLIVYKFSIGWIILMLSIAILTTLYGHLVEKREL